MKWAPDLVTAQQQAQRSGKLILIHFSADHCPPCVRVEKNVFSLPNVAYQVDSQFVAVHINASEQPQIAKQFQVSSWPTDLVLTAQGQELHRMTSPQDPRTYVAELGKTVWRAQSLGRDKPQVAMGQRNNPQLASRAQLPRAAAASPATTQFAAAAVPATAVPSQLPPRTQFAPKNPQTTAPASYANQAVAQSPATQAPPAYQPRTNTRNPERKPFENVARAVANQPYPAGNYIAATSATAAAKTPAANPSPQTRVPAQAPAPTAQVNPFASQSRVTPPQQPQTAVADLYPQNASGPHLKLQGHASAAGAPAAARIPVMENQGGVQRTNHEQPTRQEFLNQLPHGKDPFDGTNTGEGAVMLRNPFSSVGRTTPTPATPAPVAPAAATPVAPAAPTRVATAPAPVAVTPAPVPAPAPVAVAPTPVAVVPAPAAQTQVVAPQPTAPTPVAPQAPPEATVQQWPTQPQQQPLQPQPSSAANPTDALPPAFVAMAPPAQSSPAPTPALTPAAPVAEPANAPANSPIPSPPEDDLIIEDTASNDDDKDLAMDGYCPVTLHHEDRWVKGNEQWGALHRGKVFLFRTSDGQERFLNDPDKYSPLLSGYDPVVFHETGELKTGFRAHGVRYQDMTCLFSSEESLQKFWQAPVQFSQTAKQAMQSDTTVR